MNNICKVVWSHVHQQCVVVSEIATSVGRTQSRRRLPHGQHRRADHKTREHFSLKKVAALAALVAGGPVFAQTVVNNWATWTLPTSYPYSATTGSSRYAEGAAGSVVDPLSTTTINLTLSGEVNNTSSTNTSNWNTTYGYGTVNGAFLSDHVTTKPTGPMITQTGYTTPNYQAHTLTFSSTVSNVLMAVWSLGGTAGVSSLTFSQPFQILSQNGYITSSGDSTSGYTITGREGSGVIQFLGSYNSLSWNVTAPEFYSGFNIGLTTNPYRTYDANSITPYVFDPSVLPTPFTPAVSIPDIVSANNRTGGTGFNLLSNIGASLFNNRFDGGTLKVDSTTPATATFTITRNKGYIDQNGIAGTFSGVISNDGNDSGRLVILNSAGTVGSRAGRVILSAINTHSGGTEVQAGATLQIASASALGSGRLDLVGTATETATLAVTASTTITNSITVAGDPTFDIAGGTTTTLAGTITDGSSAGDVVKIGAGTLVLTAANNYTGPTTIDAGVLALTGAGSIANSTAVTNHATFDVTAASGNVTLGGTYTQGAGGTLKMNVSADPLTNQRVNVTGTASLDGTLDLAASAGSYRSGRYTLMTSAGLGGSRFSAFSSNLGSVTNHSYSLGYDANNVYLELRSSAADTMASIRALGGDLNKVYNAQYGVAQLGLSYDCKLFDEKNLCLSAGARTTHSRADGSTYDGVALIAAYRARPDVRLGGWIDQNESRKMGMNVTAGNSTPMFGAFAVWNENPQTGEGLQLKLSGAYGQKDLSLARPVVGTSERGQGNARLSTLVAEASVAYGMALNARTSISPFAGLRYASMSNKGYTEGADVFSPLSFAKTSQSAKSVMAGVNLYDKPEGPIGLDLSAGVERYISTSAAQISATGLDGLSAVQMTPVLSKNRPFASASLRFDIAKNQQLLFGLSHSKHFTNSDWVTSATVRYVLGL